MMTTIKTPFAHELSINAIWRDRIDAQSLLSAAQQTLPVQLCNEASATITGWPEYAVTPLYSLPYFADQRGLAAVYCKDEGSRLGLGSFKALGGAYAVAQAAANNHTLTVACATEGNHGRSVAWGAQRANAQCVIFLHERVSAAREAAIARYGARIIRVPGSYDDAVRECARVAEENGWQIIADTTWNGYEDIPRQIMAGYSVVADEIADALDSAPTHVFLQAGVGGMAAASMASLSRKWPGRSIQFVVVEPKVAACLFASVQAGGRHRAVGGPFDTITAGLACGEPSVAVIDLIYQGSKMMLALDDEVIKRAMRTLALPEGDDAAIVAGASGAAGFAGLLASLETPVIRDALGLGTDSRVLVINTENDTDPDAYRSIVAA